MTVFKNNPIYFDETSQNNSSNMREKLLKYIQSVKIEPEDQKTLKAVTGLEGHCEMMHMGDIDLRDEMTACIVQLFDREFAAHPEQHWYLFTPINDVGHTSDRCPHVALKQINDNAALAIKALGAQGFGIIEGHPLKAPLDGQPGRSFMFGGHYVLITETPLDLKAAKSKLAALKLFQCSLGAKPFKLQKIDRTAKDIRRVARYIAKMPHSAKNPMPHKKKPGRVLLMDTIKGYRPDFAMRLFEGLSQIAVPDVILAVGPQGRALRNALLGHLRTWHRARPKANMLLATFDRWKWWATFRLKNGSSDYLPFRFDDALFKVRKTRAPKRPGTRLRITSASGSVSTRRRFPPRRMMLVRKPNGPVSN